MAFLILIFTLSAAAVGGNAMLNETKNNLYVIHAIEYQVGILTNSTEDDDGIRNATGNEEAVTFYHSNGSSIDLSSIPGPLLTSIAGQSVLSVAAQPTNNSITPTGVPDKREIAVADVGPYKKEFNKEHGEESPITLQSLEGQIRPDIVKIVEGKGVVPPDVNSIGIRLPSLFNFTSNFTEIPVPIPNAAVLQYTKINTLVKPINNGTNISHP